MSTEKSWIVVKIAGKIVNIEVNTSFNEETRKRNFAYICKIHSSTIKKGEKYAMQPESIQINFNYNVSNRKKYKEAFEMRSEEGTKYNVGLKVLEINVDKYRLAWYNKNIEITRKNPMLTAISFEDKESLDEYVKYIDDENVRRVRDKVEALNDDSIFASELSYYERGMINARNDGYCDGKEIGEKSGLRKARLEMATGLIIDGFSDEKVAKYTKISLNKIKKLKEEIFNK